MKNINAGLGTTGRKRGGRKREVFWRVDVGLRTGVGSLVGEFLL